MHYGFKSFTSPASKEAVWPGTLDVWLSNHSTARNGLENLYFWNYVCGLVLLFLYYQFLLAFETHVFTVFHTKGFFLHTVHSSDLLLFGITGNVNNSNKTWFWVEVFLFEVVFVVVIFGRDLLHPIFFPHWQNKSSYCGRLSVLSSACIYLFDYYYHAALCPFCWITLHAAGSLLCSNNRDSPDNGKSR